MKSLQTILLRIFLLYLSILISTYFIQLLQNIHRKYIFTSKINVSSVQDLNFPNSSWNMCLYVIWTTLKYLVVVSLQVIFFALIICIHICGNLYLRPSWTRPNCKNQKMKVQFCMPTFSDGRGQLVCLISTTTHNHEIFFEIERYTTHCQANDLGVSTLVDSSCMNSFFIPMMQHKKFNPSIYFRQI